MQAEALVATQGWTGLLRQAESWAKAAPDNPDAWSFTVRAACEKKQPDAEFLGWKALCRIDPSQRGHALGLGWQLALHQEYDEALAITTWRRLAGLRSGDAKAQWKRATAYLQAGRCTRLGGLSSDQAKT